MHHSDSSDFHLSDVTIVMLMKHTFSFFLLICSNEFIYFLLILWIRAGKENCKGHSESTILKLKSSFFLSYCLSCFVNLEGLFIL